MEGDLLEQHCGRLGASHSQLEPLVLFSVSRFVDGVAHWLIEEVAAHLMMLTNVAASASGCLELDPQYIMEL